MRLGARLSPEIVAAILAVGFLVAAVPVLVPRAIRTPGTSGPAASQSAAPSASTGPSLKPGAARSVLEINGHLLELQASLIHEAARRTTDPVMIGDLLRQVNTQLVAIETAGLADLARDPVTADVATRFRDANAAAFAAARRTLSASISNGSAYHDGARQVADALAPLAALDRELEKLISARSPAPTAVQSIGAS
jgi:hypothetical protein